MIIIPKYVSDIISLIENAGYSAYIVGGSVRDLLLGREVHDFDIATSAVPEEILRIFKSFRAVKNGIKHGTVGVVSDGILVEITTFRSDGKYTDLRRPDSVSYVKKIEDDLARRDFTINAVAYSERDGIIDPYGGQRDLETKIIRCVGNPETRFSEDALRIMRGLRFSSVLGFDIEAGTLQAMLNKKHLLKKIAAERISSELKGTLLGDGVLNALLSYRDIIYEIIPELETQSGYVMKKYPDITLWEHTAAAVSMTEKCFPERLAMLLHDVGKPRCKVIINGEEKYPGHSSASAETAQKILSRLRYDKKTNAYVMKLIESHSLLFPKTLIEMRLFVRDHGLEFTKMWLDIKRADVFSKTHEKSTEQLYYNAIEFFNEIVRGKLCCTISELDISGNDLIEIGINDRKIKNALNILLEAVIFNKCENEIQALKKYAASIYNNC